MTESLSVSFNFATFSSSFINFSFLKLRVEPDGFTGIVGEITFGIGLDFVFGTKSF